MGIGEKEQWSPGNNSSRIPRATWDKTTFNCKHFFLKVQIINIVYINVLFCVKTTFSVLVPRSIYSILSHSDLNPGCARYTKAGRGREWEGTYWQEMYTVILHHVHKRSLCFIPNWTICENKLSVTWL